MVDAVCFPVFLSMLRGNIGNGWDVVLGLVLSWTEPGALPPLVGEKESVEVSAFSGGDVPESSSSSRLSRKGCAYVQAGDYAVEGLALPEVVNKRISVERYGYSIVCRKSMYLLMTLVPNKEW
ncbi:uncharacterized protein ARMOST_20487 [Armillaria ostoyae]|uniref:Uncharacterized protein n=1 Tax=Armillaria ostoyae TaxID=47428 RepID=A0A284S7H1_ARMOS|nr:uncharacterized protein ARMOST_20487 [Armillaria ostoyae]